jgi:hypothetical protein
MHSRALRDLTTLRKSPAPNEPKTPNVSNTGARPFSALSASSNPKEDEPGSIVTPPKPSPAGASPAPPAPSTLSPNSASSSASPRLSGGTPPSPPEPPRHCAISPTRRRLRIRNLLPHNRFPLARCMQLSRS